MSSKSSGTSGKSPYQRGNSSRRGRGKLLLITVVILLFATAAWITTYTTSVAKDPTAITHPVDPAGHVPATDSGANGGINTESPKIGD